MLCVVRISHRNVSMNYLRVIMLYALCLLSSKKSYQEAKALVKDTRSFLSKVNYHRRKGGFKAHKDQLIDTGFGLINRWLTLSSTCNGDVMATKIGLDKLNRSMTSKISVSVGMLKAK